MGAKFMKQSAKLGIVPFLSVQLKKKFVIPRAGAAVVATHCIPNIVLNYASCQLLKTVEGQT